MASSDNRDSGASDATTKRDDVESGDVGDWRQVRELDFLYAARLIKDAIELRNITFKKTFDCIKSYEVFLDTKLTTVLRITILVHLLLPIFEEPAVVATPYWVPCILETICLFIFMLRWVHLRTIETTDAFHKDKKNWVLLVVFLLILIDLVVFIVAHELNFSFKHRLTRPLRVLFYINFIEGKELRRAFRNVRKTLPDILNVFTLFLVSILIFGFLAFKLFNGKLDANKNPIAYSNGEPYFQNYEDSIWDLYISVTTANFPDVMMPAYDLNGAYSIFFIIFMLVNFYIFINIILATIYTNYKKHLKEEVKTTLEYKRAKVKDAFDLIKENLYEVIRSSKSASSSSSERSVEFKKTDYILSEHEQVVTYETFRRLIVKIDPKKTDKRINVLFDILDTDRNNLLSFREFVHLADLLSIRMSEIKDRQVLLERLLPNIYNSKPSQIVRKIVGLRLFQYAFDLLIFLNIIFVIFLSDKPNYEWFFLSLFLVEILLKIYTCGFRKFVSLYWNIFDTIIIVGSLIAGIVEAAEGADLSGGQKRKSTELFEIILVLRSLRVLKFVSAIKRFRTIITTIAIITPSLVTYGMLLLTIYYVYAMIGMEIFGGTIQTQTYTGAIYDCRNPNLNGTDFVKYKYCKNNFSSFPNSLIILFELMVVNQWHILSKGFEYAMGTKWTRLYFFAFHLTCVIVSLNIFTAFVIEAFLLEYETEGDAKSAYSKVEERIIKLGLHYIEGDQDEDDAGAEAAIPITQRLKRFVVQLCVSKNPYYSDVGAKLNANVNTDEEDQNVMTSGSKSAIRFHIYSRDAKPVEILLQRMFSDEFDIEQEDLLSASASASTAAASS